MYFTNFIASAKEVKICIVCIGQTSRHLKTREHIPKFVLKFIKEKTNNKKTYKRKKKKMWQKDLR